MATLFKLVRCINVREINNAYPYIERTMYIKKVTPKEGTRYRFEFYSSDDIDNKLFNLTISNIGFKLKGEKGIEIKMIHKEQIYIFDAIAGDSARRKIMKRM